MRRFIAGAVCPECRSIDRIVVEPIAQGRQRRCVDCGHSEALVESITPEPATRFTTRASPATPVERVRFIDAGSQAARGTADDPPE